MDDTLRDVTGNCRIRIDKDGRWFYENSEIINPLVLQSFWEALEQDDQGRWRINIPPEVCYLEVEDTPLVIAAIRESPTGITLVLNNLHCEQMNPAQLDLAAETAPRYTLADGMEVRFSRTAFHCLGSLLAEDDEGNVVLRCGDGEHCICTAEELAAMEE